MVGNIFFVGLMGAGKTTVGRLVAKHLNKEFYDSDHEIERRTGVNIPLIFELEGEAGFRRREAAVIDELAHTDNIVLATGGGAVLLPENREVLKRNGTVVYLRANVNELWQRTRNDKNRPLLQTDNPRQKLEQLFEQRDPLYQEVATVIVDTGGQAVGSIVHEIEKRLSQLPLQDRQEVQSNEQK
ncbi:MAG: shikimate kinase AroK [Betaproteobacteria bacterium HGW-Betaproteobacteria-2]|nr:MAG: shikimate kinase AroK [Betaproteobacteria bacterium HGW-Betaproteobacteria-2]